MQDEAGAKGLISVPQFEPQGNHNGKEGVKSSAI